MATLPSQTAFASRTGCVFSWEAAAYKLSGYQLQRPTPFGRLSDMSYADDEVERVELRVVIWELKVSPKDAAETVEALVTDAFAPPAYLGDMIVWSGPSVEIVGHNGTCSEEFCGALPEDHEHDG